MSFSLVVVAATFASVTSVLWLRKRRHAAWLKDMQDWIDDARRGFDDPIRVRRLAPHEDDWSGALDDAMAELATLPADAIQLADLVAVVDDTPYQAIRSFAHADKKRITFLTLNGDQPPVVGIASYTDDGRYLTVSTEGVWFARSPLSRVLRIDADAPVSELLLKHAAHVAGQHLLEVATTDDYIVQLERMERLESEWRQRQPSAALLEYDMKTVLGEERYGRLAGVLRTVPPRVPHARVHERVRS